MSLEKSKYFDIQVSSNFVNIRLRACTQQQKNKTSAITSLFPIEVDAICVDKWKQISSLVFKVPLSIENNLKTSLTVQDVGQTAHLS